MENYKGIYYQETKEQKYYEGGAHFPYKVLFNILLHLGGKIYQENDYNKNYDNYTSNNLRIKKQEEKIKVKYKTRNIEQNENYYRNNPNTLIKFPSQNMFKSNESNKKNYFSRNDINTLYNGYDYLNNKNYSISINIQQPKKNMDNHLLKMLLNKKEKAKHNEEKNNDEISSDNRYSFLKFYKNAHNRNRSEYCKNIEDNQKNKINKFEKTNENEKNNFFTYIKNKIHLIKSYKNDMNSLEINGKNKESLKINEIINRNNDNISEIRGQPQKKAYLNHFENMAKKSRNIGSGGVVDLQNTYENNKNDLSRNYIKKPIKNYLFKTSDDNQIQGNFINNGTIFSISKDKMNLVNYHNNNCLKNVTINNKEIKLKQRVNNYGLQKYKRKKINQLCCFNQNNGKSKSGNNIFAKNINKINIVHNKAIKK